ncbi:MAG TPA: dihydroorotate dehydrogenase electron transfer subunit, partial [Desulfurivibrionaceae bacterium]|nr:dihydroorotate dehydrogenase electron transfer subunit [Desulfurivibrionaceae bacterium]
QEVERRNAHAAARPGQFLMLRVGEGRDPLLRRPLSIHQVTANGWVQVLFKVVGQGTRLLAALAPGQAVDVVGPLGNRFALHTGRNLCLVGGGMGIAPLYFLARELQRSNPPEAVVPILGARTAAELRPLADDFVALGLEPRLATDDGTLGHHGLVIDLLSELMATSALWTVYTCGPYPMMRAVAKLCREQGWECQVSLETMMACGLAACLGCAIPAAQLDGPYKHVCKDGPVFGAEEVAWL